MANRKISEFTALTAPASGDTFAILDVDASGIEVNKKITYANVLGKAPDGSASAPAFSFNSDTNSGISGGSDTLVLSTGGTAAISVDSSQNVVLSANLTVSGTTTTIDTTTLTVKDKNIEIAKGNGNDAAVDGAGITIDSTDGDKTWNWVDATDAWTSSEHIHLGDDKKLLVGTGSDLKIYHNGSNSFIEESGTGALYIDSNHIVFRKQGTGEVLSQFIGDGGVNLYYDNGLKLETLSNGVQVWGHLRIPDSDGTNDKLQIGNGQDLTLYHDGSNSYLTNGTGELQIRATHYDQAVTLNPDGAVELFYDASKKLETTSAGITVTGALTATSFVGALTGNVTGNASGSSGSCTGNAATATEATNVTVSANNSTDETVYPVFVDGATGTQGAETDTGLTYNPSTGLLTSTGFSGSGASLTTLNASNLSSGTVNVARLGSGSSVTTKFLRGDNTWQTVSGTPEGTAILSTGESGASKYLREDGDGTCSWQAVPAAVGGATGVDFNDSVKVRFGTGNDSDIFHDGSNMYLTNTVGSIYIQGKAGENSLKATPDGAVEAYYDNAKKFETLTAGVQVWGHLRIPDSDGTTDKLEIGNGQDLTLYHDGTNSFIKNSTGNLRIQDDDGNIQVQAKAGEESIIAKADGAVEAYYDNSKKFETTSTGATVTGVATVSNGIVETAITIATNHTITTNYNAMSAGPVTVSATVTVPSGSVWTVI